MNNQHCAACKQFVDFRKQFDIRDYFGTRTYSIDQCPVCGVMKTDPVPEDLASYYAGNNMTTPQNPVYHQLKRVLLRQEMNRILKYTGSKSFLDLGSGYGDFSELLFDSGYDVVAADSGEERPCYIKDKTDIPYIGFDYETMQIEKPELASGRTLVLRNVLEHVTDPHAFLGNFVSAGISYAYIVVPDVASSERKFFGEYYYSWHVPFHLWHFDENSLTSLLNSAGMKVVKSGHYTIPTFVNNLYRYLLINNRAAWLRGVLDPNGWLSAMSVPLNMLFFRKNVLWVIAATK